ncbi:MAG: hypothetical protein RL007_425 [Bacteroidota bacterium]|jgi:peptidoglycan/LPS O-acetylase OafA/YrhL
MEAPEVQSRPISYYPELDALRTIAITGVLISHFFPVFGTPLFAGQAGVELFFVLSGFLITQRITFAIRSEKKGALKRFLIRRALRILPLTFIVLAASFILNIYPVKEQFVFLFTFSFNYSAVYFKLPYNTLSHFWTLCIEEQFYLIWPSALILIRKIRFVIVITALLIAFAWIQLAFSPIAFLQPFNGSGTHTRIAGLLIGSLGALFYSRMKLLQRLSDMKITEIIVPAIIGLLLIFSRNSTTIPLLEIAFLILVLKALSGFRHRVVQTVMRNKAIVYVGKISFGIYILHPFVQYGIAQIPGCSENQLTSISGSSSSLLTAALAILGIAFSIASAAASYHLLEKPLLNLRDRTFPAPM